MFLTRGSENMCSHSLGCIICDGRNLFLAIETKLWIKTANHITFTCTQEKKTKLGFTSKMDHGL